MKILIMILAVVLLVGCNNTKVETQAGGGSTAITTNEGWTCTDNPDGSKTCLPTKSTVATGQGGSTSVRTESNSSWK